MSDIQVITENVFPIIKSAVDKTVNAIKPTYGPASNKVIISLATHKMVVDDGVQIARDIKLEDPAENAVLGMVRETAVKTNDLVGDGTTSSLIMLQAIIGEVAQMTRWEGHKIERELKKGAAEAKEQLIKKAKPVKSYADLVKVARISFDDADIADMIASTWDAVGKEGVVTVDSSQGLTTTSEIAEGLKFQRGYISPYMITNPERMEGIIEKPYILLTDMRLTEATDVIPVMEMLAKKNVFNLVIIAENVEQSALATLIVNKVQGKFTTIAITIPPAENSRVMLEDIALLTGARVFSSDKGDKVQEATIEDLGRADRFICRRESSVILRPKGKKADVQTAVDDLKAAIAIAPTPKEKEVLQKRYAFFTNKIAVIKVGAPTENEQKSLRYKVEDSVNAVRAAFNGGVVCGAGLSLARLKTSSPLLNKALQYPFRQLMNNMGRDIPSKPLPPDHAINVRTDKTGNYMEVGVIDPVDVLIAGIESAVSIASLLVTTSGIIVEKPPKPKTE